MTEYAFEGPTRSGTSLTWSYATATYARDAAYPFAEAISSMYQATIQAAFDRWSSVSGVSFTQVADSASAAIRIGFGVFSSPYTVGETVIRSSGGYLANDTVVRLVDPSVYALSLSAASVWTYAAIGITLYQVALHEIGHALGLDHTTDPATVMYPVSTTQNTDLAAGDIEGINELYPLYTVAALDPVQVQSNVGVMAYHFTITRHDDLSLSRSINYSVVGAAYPGLSGTVAATASDFVGGAFPTGQLTFAAGAASVTLTIDVAASTTAQPDEGFAIALSGATASISATARGSLNAVILDDSGSAVGSAAPLPVYRFFDTIDGTHFFTASEAERNALIQSRPDLIYEGAKLTAVANPAADPAAVSVFRFFDLEHGTHFYTDNAAERDTVLGNRTDLVYEGSGFYEHATQQTGDVPVYRFFETTNGTHFFTSDATERATLLATRADFVDEGIAFYAPTTA